MKHGKRKNLRELKFVEEYLLDGNATQAAIRAGYSKRTANEQGSQLLARLSHLIQPRLIEQRKALRKEIGITKERIIKELACIVFQDAGDFYDKLGNVIEIPELKARARRAIAGFEFTEDFLNAKDKGGDTQRVASGYTKKIRTWDKVKATELLIKLLGMMPKEHDRGVKDDMTLEELVLGSMELEEKEKQP